MTRTVRIVKRGRGACLTAAGKTKVVLTALGAAGCLLAGAVAPRASEGNTLLSVNPTQLTLVPTVPSCAVGGQKTFGVGSSQYVRGELVGRATISAPSTTRRDSVVDGKVRGCFAGHCADLARAALEGHSSGGSAAKLTIAGRTIFSQGLASRGSKSFGPYILKTSLGGSIPLIPGILSASASAGIGAGAQFSVGYDIRAMPPLADIQGYAKSFANGNGEVGVSVLGGLGGKASIDATLGFPSPTVVADLNTSICSVSNSTGRVVLNPWQLTAKASWKVGCVPFLGCAYSGSKTLMNQGGSSETFTVL